MVSVQGALAGGFIGTLVLTTGLRAATAFRLTRIDLPFLLGTVFTADRTRARALGYVLHFLFGLLFAGVYYLVFEAIDQASWWLGSLLGVVQALFAATALVSVLLPLVHPRMGTPFSAADSAPLLEPPGFMLMNYGVSTPIVMLVSHIIYGAIVGAAAAS